MQISNTSALSDSDSSSNLLRMPAAEVLRFGIEENVECVISFLRYGYYVLATANHELHVDYAHTTATGYSNVR